MSIFRLLRFDSLEDSLGFAIQSAISNYSGSDNNPHDWAQNELRNTVERNVRNNFLTNAAKANFSGMDRKPPGFGVTFSLQIILSFKVKFRSSVNVGYGFRNGNLAGTGSLHVAAYNRGLGVGVGKSNLVFDVTAAVVLTAGSRGYAVPLQSYSLNYNSPIPMLNDFKNSFSYGQILTWNSGLNEKRFSLSDVQRQGMIGFRIGNVNVSTNNDTRFYLGAGTDFGWTGGITLNTPFFEVGFQDFSGKFIEDSPQVKAKAAIEEEIKNVKRQLKVDDGVPIAVKEKMIKDLEKDLYELLENNYYPQTPYQKNLNKASTYIRFNNSFGKNITIDLIGDAWLQNGIHILLKNFWFEYNCQKISSWNGVSF